MAPYDLEFFEARREVARICGEGGFKRVRAKSHRGERTKLPLLSSSRAVRVPPSPPVTARLPSTEARQRRALDILGHTASANHATTTTLATTTAAQRVGTAESASPRPKSRGGAGGGDGMASRRQELGHHRQLLFNWVDNLGQPSLITVQVRERDAGHTPLTLLVMYNLQPAVATLRPRDMVYLALLDAEKLRRKGSRMGLDILASSESPMARECICSESGKLLRVHTDSPCSSGLRLSVQALDRGPNGEEGVIVRLVVIPWPHGPQDWRPLGDAVAIRLDSVARKQPAPVVPGSIPRSSPQVKRQDNDWAVGMKVTGMAVQQLRAFWEEVKQDLELYCFCHRVCPTSQHHICLARKEKCPHAPKMAHSFDEHRGVPYEQINELSPERQAALQKIDVTAAFVASRYVHAEGVDRPSALKSARPSQVGTYICHSPGLGFGELLQTLEAMFGPEDVVFLPCFGVNQGPFAQNSYEAKNLRTCSRALTHAQSVAIIPGPRLDFAWSHVNKFEIREAMKLRKPLFVLPSAGVDLPRLEEAVDEVEVAAQSAESPRQAGPNASKKVTAPEEIDQQTAQNHTREVLHNRIAGYETALLRANSATGFSTAKFWRVYAEQERKASVQEMSNLREQRLAALSYRAAGIDVPSGGRSGPGRKQNSPDAAPNVELLFASLPPTEAPYAEAPVQRGLEAQQQEKERLARHLREVEGDIDVLEKQMEELRRADQTRQEEMVDERQRDMENYAKAVDDMRERLEREEARVSKLEKELLGVRTAAAIQIQCAWRAWLAQKEANSRRRFLQDQEEANRRRLSLEDREAREAARHAAALRIQTGWRAHWARGEASRRRAEAARRVARWQREADREAAEWCCRRSYWLAAARVPEQEVVAEDTEEQDGTRGAIKARARDVVDDIIRKSREEAAAIRIQSILRGNQARRKASPDIAGPTEGVDQGRSEREHWAALRIQTAWRRYLARKELARRRAAAAAALVPRSETPEEELARRLSDEALRRELARRRGLNPEQDDFNILSEAIALQNNEEEEAVRHEITQDCAGFLGSLVGRWRVEPDGILTVEPSGHYGIRSGAGSTTGMLQVHSWIQEESGSVLWCLTMTCATWELSGHPISSKVGVPVYLFGTIRDRSIWLSEGSETQDIGWQTKNGVTLSLFATWLGSLVNRLVQEDAHPDATHLPLPLAPLPVTSRVGRHAHFAEDSQPMQAQTSTASASSYTFDVGSPLSPGVQPKGSSNSEDVKSPKVQNRASSATPDVDQVVLPTTPHERQLFRSSMAGVWSLSQNDIMFTIYEDGKYTYSTPTRYAAGEIEVFDKVAAEGGEPLWQLVRTCRICEVAGETDTAEVGVPVYTLGCVRRGALWIHHGSTDKEDGWDNAVLPTLLQIPRNRSGSTSRDGTSSRAGTASATPRRVRFDISTPPETGAGGGGFRRRGGRRPSTDSGGPQVQAVHSGGRHLSILPGFASSLLPGGGLGQSKAECSVEDRLRFFKNMKGVWNTEGTFFAVHDDGHYELRDATRYYAGVFEVFGKVHREGGNALYQVKKTCRTFKHHGVPNPDRLEPPTYALCLAEDGGFWMGEECSDPKEGWGLEMQTQIPVLFTATDHELPPRRGDKTTSGSLRSMVDEHGLPPTAPVTSAAEKKEFLESVSGAWYTPKAVFSAEGTGRYSLQSYSRNASGELEMVGTQKGPDGETVYQVAMTCKSWMSNGVEDPDKKGASIYSLWSFKEDGLYLSKGGTSKEDAFRDNVADQELMLFASRRPQPAPAAEPPLPQGAASMVQRPCHPEDRKAIFQSMSGTWKTGPTTTITVYSAGAFVRMSSDSYCSGSLQVCGLLDNGTGDGVLWQLIMTCTTWEAFGQPDPGKVGVPIYLLGGIKHGGLWMSHGSMSHQEGWAVPAAGTIP